MIKGTKFKIKNGRGTYTFTQYVQNHDLGTEWIDCFEDDTRQFRSFRPEKISRIVKPKAPRKRKVSV